MLSINHYLKNDERLFIRDLFEIGRIFSGRAETLDDVEEEYQKEMIGIAKVHRFVCGERKMYSMDKGIQNYQSIFLLCVFD